MSDADLDWCRAAIRTGSHSFHAASRLLPARYRDPALALYAFCRCADDAVDEHDDKAAAVLRLGERLDLAYRGTPRDAPADRAFADMVQATGMPQALPDALLEGLAWDAGGRRHASLSDVRAYSARVAAAVGAMMCVIMGVRDADALARACDLGVAMQLTNIARDVGEDARAGRLYLPLDWMAAAGIDPDGFLAAPSHSPALADVVRRLLDEATRLYRRSGAGVVLLPPACRPGIFAARAIYAAIGGHVARAGHDSITRRARTTGAEKLALLTGALAEAATASVMPRSAVLHAAPLDETRFLVDAAASRQPATGRGTALIGLLAQLAEQDRARARTAQVAAA
jgi:phytoene synthase